MQRLQSLVSGGQLRIVYVVGVPRANTTILCRLLGMRLHGAVYEPAFPDRAFPETAYAHKILAAFDAIRLRLLDDRPVALAVKDLSALMTPAETEFALAHARHIVFAIREPASQYASLVRQLLTQFSLSQQMREFARMPWRSIMYGFHFGLRLPRYHRLASTQLGVGISQLRRMVATGSNLDSWRALVRQFEQAVEKVPADRLSVFDAGLSRLRPDLAEHQLDSIAATISPPISETASGIDFPSHPLVARDSAWVGEALTSKTLKRSHADPKLASPYRDFEQWRRRVAGALYPGYAKMFFHSTHRLRTKYLAEPGAPADATEATLDNLLQAEDANSALSLARERGTIVC